MANYPEHSWQWGILKTIFGEYLSVKKFDKLGALDKIYIDLFKFVLEK